MRWIKWAAVGVGVLIVFEYFKNANALPISVPGPSSETRQGRGHF